ncbi:MULTISPECIES: C39 family peptidase [unclassified Microcoleus]|uniref:C39 family peptidase n=1 Tax=unclassified Microcoleus TaxID=2642155 RepID=UPI002FD5DABD
MSVILNVPFKSQLDNKFNPTGSCNVTSIAMCLEYLGCVSKSALQLEDELYQYITHTGLNPHSPYDLAQIVVHYGYSDSFKVDATITECQAWLKSGMPIVMHGYFTNFGHIITGIGYDDTGFWVHDPYGEWFDTGYRTDLSGANLHYSYNLIKEKCIPDGSFWVHFISK